MLNFHVLANGYHLGQRGEAAEHFVLFFLSVLGFARRRQMTVPAGLHETGGVYALALDSVLFEEEVAVPELAEGAARLAHRRNPRQQSWQLLLMARPQRVVERVALAVAFLRQRRYLKNIGRGGLFFIIHVPHQKTIFSEILVD